jgi:hypothetical protein
MPIPCRSGQFLTMAQAQSVLRQAGFPESEIVDMGAIGKAESSLCPTAYNPNGENSIGVWQINMNAHGTRFGTREQLFDPLTNARAALAVYKEAHGKRPWGAYTDGRYRKYLAESQQAAGQPVTYTQTNSGSQNSKEDDTALYVAVGILVLLLLT